jgi:hypothetical protein
MRVLAVGAIVGVVFGTAARTAAHADAPLKAQHDRTKIVRIERPRGGSHGFMFCVDVRAGEGNCIGTSQPKIGDRIDVVDNTQRIARAKITGLAERPNRDPSCAVMWTVQFDLETGSVASSRGQLVGMIGVSIEPGGHWLNGNSNMKVPAAVSGGNDENVLIGVDRDGDNELDYALTLYNCANTGAQVSKYGSDFCVNVWAIDHDHYTKVQQITSEQLQPCLH